MIQNVVFDMGNVLVKFAPEVLIEKLAAEEDRKLLAENVLAEEWKTLDRGTITEEEGISRVCQRLPERLRYAARYIMEHQIETLLPFQEAYELVEELKAKGYGVYLLSNVSVQFHQFWEEIPVLHLMDGKIISSDLLSVKPEEKIYRTLFETYHLDPRECFFVDDLPQNIEGGRALGMDGYVFDGDFEKLRKVLEEKGVL